MPPPVSGLAAPRLTGLERERGWASWPPCWGQRRLWDPVQAANGEGAILVAAACPECLGLGEVLR